MEMKVCKLVRLTTKNDKGNFINGEEGKVTLRPRVVVSEESVKETKDNYKITGLLYVVDEAATTERNKQIEAKVSASREPAFDADDAPTLAELAEAKKAEDEAAKVAKEAADKKLADDTVKAAKAVDKTPPTPGTL